MADRPDSSSLIPISMILPGIGLALVGMRFDGFVQGLFEGAGIALILLGVYLFGAHRRRPREDDDAMWLPSRDEDER